MIHLNLSALIQVKPYETLLLESYYDDDLSINGKHVEPRAFVAIQKEDIPYIKNMLTLSDYVLYNLRKGVNELDKVNGETVVRFSELPSSIRNEVRQEAPRTRDSDIFFLSYYGK